MLGLGLGLTSRLRASTLLIPQIFTNGEPGAWYDPSDIATLFQDSAGTTPVTAPGQPVGLVLDKSKGLVLGPELVTNGGFDSATTGWGTANATLAVVAGELLISNQSASPVSATQSILGLTVGKTYEVTVTSRLGGTGGTVARASFFGVIFASSTGASVTQTARILATSTSATLSLFSFGTSATIAYFDNISVRELPGNHATQATAAARPTYQSSGGLSWLAFDGVDDFLVTPTITPGVDKVQVFAGVRKLSDAAVGTLVESGVSTSSVAGTFGVFAPRNASTANYGTHLRQTARMEYITAASFAAPISNVLTSLYDFAEATAELENRLRVNGIAQALSVVDAMPGPAGAGNFTAQPIYIGRRAGTTLPFNGNLYSLIVRFGANLDAARIGQVERYVAARTGVTL